VRIEIHAAVIAVAVVEVPVEHERSGFLEVGEGVRAEIVAASHGNGDAPQ
jgi:hypothetical protein